MSPNVGTVYKPLDDRKQYLLYMLKSRGRDMRWVIVDVIVLGIPGVCVFSDSTFASSPLETLLSLCSRPFRRPVGASDRGISRIAAAILSLFSRTKPSCYEVLPFPCPLHGAGRRSRAPCILICSELCSMMRPSSLNRIEK